MRSIAYITRMTASEICADCAVRDRALCGSLSDTELGALNVLGQRRSLARGETLVWAGDDALVCANLLSGVLKITDSAPDGREQIVGLLYPADFVGRPFADSADFSVTALTDATLCIFPRLPFERVLEDHVRMERLLLQRTFAALADARRRMLVLARKSSREKVAGFLLDMADRAEDSGCRASADGPITFDLPMTRGQIAAVLGITIETVSRQLTALKTAGLIALPTARAVTIRDRAGLAARADAGRRLERS
jgi:CRP/FNR family transcriptional regulator